jgi:hypothetical protein
MGRMSIKLRYIGVIGAPFRGKSDKHIMHLHVFHARNKPRIHIGVYAETEMVIPEEDLIIYLTGERIARWINGHKNQGRTVDGYETT